MDGLFDVLPWRTLRLARGASQVAIAERAGLHRGYLSRVERAQQRLSLRAARRLWQALDGPRLAFGRGIVAVLAEHRYKDISTPAVCEAYVRRFYADLPRWEDISRVALGLPETPALPFDEHLSLIWLVLAAGWSFSIRPPAPTDPQLARAFVDFVVQFSLPGEEKGPPPAPPPATEAVDIDVLRLYWGDISIEGRRVLVDLARLLSREGAP